MACILKLPSDATKGIISITNIELQRQVSRPFFPKKCLDIVKDRYFILYHPNWEDHSFSPPDWLDGILARKENFDIEINCRNSSVPIFQYSSNIMSPSAFRPASKEHKIWDFCQITRVQKRKNIEGLFRVVKKTFEQNPHLTGVVIAAAKDKSYERKLRGIYNKTFSRIEKNQFEFVTLSFDHPFPLSKKFLSHILRHSSVMLNTHLGEPHGRVVGYSLACGNPVVCYETTSRMLHCDYRKPPYIYRAEDGNEEELKNQLQSAIMEDNLKKGEGLRRKIAAYFQSGNMAQHLKQELMQTYSVDALGWHVYDLDNRLSAHHDGYTTSNSYPLTLRQFLQIVAGPLKNLDIGAGSIERHPLFIEEKTHSLSDYLLAVWSHHSLMRVAKHAVRFKRRLRM